MILSASEKEISRAAIYVIYDRHGIIDDYVIYFLKSLKPFVKHILVVVNGFVNYEGYKKLEAVSHEILVRDNKGYDITGYKAGIEHITWGKMVEYDECMLINSSLYGPFYPFAEMFDAMNQRDVDFWGITKFHKCEYRFEGCKYDYTPEHIQSSFLVIRKSMNVSPKYRSVWDDLPEIQNYEQAIGLFELPFTKESIEKGFCADVYINTDDLEGYTRYPLMMLADELVINRRCPIMKQKAFSQWYFDILDESIGYATYNAFEFIKAHTDYDTTMIWDNILRTANMADIKNHMKLNFTLPSAYLSVPNEQSPHKVALIMHIYYQEQITEMFSYAKNMPESAYVIIITPNKKLMNDIKLAQVSLVQTSELVIMENRGRDVSALLVAAYPKVLEFDLVCFVHDKKSNYIKPYNNGRSFFYQCMENLLGSAEYVSNIIHLFELEPKMGMLMPPPPCHGDYYQILSSEWAGDYPGTCELAAKLKLHTDIHPDKPPITPLGTMFWFRPHSLHTLFEQHWRYEDFPQEPNGTDGTLLHFIERVYGFVCQNDGYYNGWVMTDRFAGMYLQNFYFMTREINLKTFRYFWPRHFFDMINRFDTHVAGGIAIPAGQSKVLFSTKVRRKLKKILPYRVYRFMVMTKRKLFGPKDKPFNFNE